MSLELKSTHPQGCFLLEAPGENLFLNTSSFQRLLASPGCGSIIIISVSMITLLSLLTQSSSILLFCLFVLFISITVYIQYYFVLVSGVRHSAGTIIDCTSQSVPPDVSSTHLAPNIVITILLTRFPMLYFTFPWQFYNYQTVFQLLQFSPCPPSCLPSGNPHSVLCIIESVSVLFVWMTIGLNTSPHTLGSRKMAVLVWSSEAEISSG